jgi:hypothetical protein
MKLRSTSALLISALISSGCGKDKAPTPPQPPAETTQVAPKGDEATQPRRGPEGATETKPTPASTAVLATSALKAAPKSAPLFVSVSLGKLLEQIDFKGLVKAFPEVFGAMSAASVELVGKDVGDLSGLDKFGLDIAKPAGAFMLDAKVEGGVLFFGLSDRKAFEALFSEVAAKNGAKVAPTAIGEANLYEVDERTALLVTADIAYVATVGRGMSGAAVAKALLARPEADSLAGLPDVQRSVNDVAAGFAGIVVQPSLLAGSEDDRKKVGAARVDEMLAPIRADLAQARADKNEARVTELEGQLKALEEAAARDLGREAGEDKLLAAVTKGIPSVVIGFDATADGISAVAQIPLAADAALGGMFRNATAPMPILRVVTSQPLLVAGVEVEIPQVLDLLLAAIAADGGDIGRMKEELKSALGVDFTELAAALTGQAGFALTGDPATLRTVRDIEAALGYTVVLGVGNVDLVKSLLAKLGTLSPKQATWDEASQALTVKTGAGGPTFTATLTGPQLVISTDADVASRLGAGASVVETYANPKLKALLGESGLAGLMAMSWGFPATTMFRSNSMTMPLPTDLPEGKEAQDKLKALEQLDAEIAKLREQVELVRTGPLFDALKKLGTVTYTLKRNDGGLSLGLGLYPEGATLAEAVRAMVGAAVNAENSSDLPELKTLRELEDKRWNLFGELSKPPVPTE